MTAPRTWSGISAPRCLKDSDAPHGVRGRGQFWPPWVVQYTLGVLRAPTTGVVVCVRDAPVWTRRCLDAVTSPGTPLTEVVVVDDGSRPETRSVIDHAAKTDPRVVVVRGSSRLWFPGAANLGVQVASCDQIILLNSDAIPSKLAIVLMSKAIEARPTAFIGPLSNAGGFQSVPWNVYGLGEFPVCEPPGFHSLEEVSVRWMSDQMEALVPVKFLNGFCIVFARQRFLELGGFDTEAYPFGYGEETDLCLRHLRSGGSNLVATHIYVPHAKTQSYTHSERSGLIADGRTALADRFGHDFIASCRSSIRTAPELMWARLRMRQLYEEMSGATP